VCPSLSETSACNTDACPSDCEVGLWGSWEPCSASCGGGQEIRRRSVPQQSAFGGAICPSTSQAQGCNDELCPIDCVLTPWDQWTFCTKTCGTGFSERHRSVAQAAVFGGRECDAEVETMECNAHACPLDCVLSGWSDWLDCSVSCRGGTQIRTRSITVEATYGGKGCPGRQQEQACNEHACHGDCVVSDWSDWSECTHSCGIGTERRNRTIITYPENGGLACPALTLVRECNTGACPVHCQVSGWKPWTHCEVTCGTGKTYRRRDITQHSMWGGSTCPSLSEEATCDEAACPVDCVMNDFGEYDACSTTCGSGYQTRHRIIQTVPQHGGVTCPVLSETRDCKIANCPVDCLVSDFQPWGGCDQTCGDGKETRTRSVARPVAYGGAHCPHLTEKRNCNTASCPVDCVVSGFSMYSVCTQSCGGGNQIRKRIVQTHSSNGGFACPHLNETRPCNMEPCPADCVTSDWSEWDLCTASCGGGQTSRTRDEVTPLSFGGKPCPAMLETKSCNTTACPVACVVSGFTGWSACDKSCGSGLQSRTRSVTRNAAHGGAACPTLVEEQPCNTEQCPVDCQTTQWSDWGDCTATCASGVQQRHRSIVAGTPKSGGQPCPALIDSRACATVPCPIHCEVSQWTTWSACTQSCDTGTMKRTRNIDNHPRHGGTRCPPLKLEQACNTQSCPIDCQVTVFGAWSECSRSCGSGRSMRGRQVTSDRGYGGKSCPSLTEEEICNTQHCPLDCVMRRFTPWTRCTKSCGSGSQSRTRTVETAPTAGGKVCGADSEQRACNIQLCAVDCEVSLWSNWTECSVSCGAGIRQKTRAVLSTEANGGQVCPVLKQQQQCDAGPCPVHCSVTDWEPWSACSQTCSGGSQSRSRSVIMHAAHGGYTCPSLHEMQTCGTDICPIDCHVGAWSAYSECSRTCGTGHATRARDLMPPKHGGAACPSSEETRECNDSECPVHCQVSEWNAWSACSKSCGFGFKSRSRSITVHRSHDGYVCPALTQEKSCNTHACPIDCIVEEWGSFGVCDKSCGIGSMTRTRTVSQQPMFSGAACPSLTTTAACNSQHCPVNCEVTAWSQPSACDKTCGGGSQHRTRVQTVAATHGGTSCPELTMTLSCGREDCPVDCVQTTWSDWGNCDLTCGSGYQTRTRETTISASHGGITCGTTAASRACNTEDCPVDCRVSAWGNFGPCTHTCGQHGSHTRTRSIDRAAVFGGVQCPVLEEVRQCNPQSCPVDCVVNGWDHFSICSVSCGNGESARHRSTITHPQFGGVACPDLVEKKVCKRGPCPVHCEISSWSAYDSCTTSCGGGLRGRHRTILTHRQHGGYRCPYLDEYRSCNEHACPADCQVSTFTKWSACDKSCGSGETMRSRNITQQPASGGKGCPDLYEHRACNTQQCPIDCQVTVWGIFGACSATCGGAVKTRTRSVLVPSAFEGVACPALTNSETCNDHACAVDCAVDQWSLFGECSKECGGGSQARMRQVTTAAAFGGVKCPALSETAECNFIQCKVNCEVSKFSQWSACTKSCQGGTQERTRTVVTASAHGGADCPELSKSRACGSELCPEDCHVSAWQPWSECTKECDGGVRQRHRNVTNPADDGGMACPALVQEEPCNLQHCVCSHVYCVLNPASKHVVVHHNATVQAMLRDWLGEESYDRYGNELMGSKHICGYNYGSETCECRCHDEAER
jgi:hypothetical protein